MSPTTSALGISRKNNSFFPLFLSHIHSEGDVSSSVPNLHPKRTRKAVYPMDMAYFVSSHCQGSKYIGDPRGAHR